MKYFSLALFLVIILVVAIFAPSFVGNVSEKNTAITKTQADKENDERAKVQSQAADEQNATPKNDSFTAGKAFDEEKDSLDPTKAMVGRGKNYLLTQVDNRLKQLRPFKTRIENMPALSDTERNTMVSELNAEIERFEAFRSEINRSATKQDIKNVAEKIKAEWLKSRRSVVGVKAQILAAKENQLISDADSVSSGIQKRIESLKASGKGTKAYEKLLSAYGKKIADAKQDIESANEKLNAVAGASTDDEKEKLIKEKDLLLKSSQENIRDAYKLLTVEAREDFSRKFK